MDHRHSLALDRVDAGGGGIQQNIHQVIGLERTQMRRDQIGHHAAVLVSAHDRQHEARGDCG